MSVCSCRRVDSSLVRERGDCLVESVAFQDAMSLVWLWSMVDGQRRRVGSFILAVTGDDDEDSLLVREREYCLVEVTGVGESLVDGRRAKTVQCCWSVG